MLFCKPDVDTHTTDCDRGGRMICCDRMLMSVGLRFVAALACAGRIICWDKILTSVGVACEVGWLEGLLESIIILLDVVVVVVVVSVIMALTFDELFEVDVVVLCSGIETVEFSFSVSSVRDTLLSWGRG